MTEIYLCLSVRPPPARPSIHPSHPSARPSIHLSIYRSGTEMLGTETPWCRIVQGFFLGWYRNVLVPKRLGPNRLGAETTWCRNVCKSFSRCDQWSFRRPNAILWNREHRMSKLWFRRTGEQSYLFQWNNRAGMAPSEGLHDLMRRR